MRKSTKFRPSLIPAGGLEIPLLLKFSCYKQASFPKMKTFVQTLHDYHFVGIITEDNSDEEDGNGICIVIHSHSYGDHILTHIRRL